MREILEGEDHMNDGLGAATWAMAVIILGLTLLLAAIAGALCGGCATIPTGAIFSAVTNAAAGDHQSETTTTTTVGDTTTTTTTAVEVSTGEPSGVVNLCPVDASKWPVTSKLTASFSGGNVTLAYDKAGVWAASGGVVGNPHILVPRAGGGFYDVTWEWLKPGQQFKQMRGKSWSGHIKRTETNGWEPVDGQGYWLYVSTLCRDGRRNGNERTSYAYAIYHK